jgi:hypothetical protein
VIGRELIGVEGLYADVGESGLGVEVAVLLRYGIANLVEEKFCRPRTNLGVLGPSGVGLLAFPTADLPVNILFISARTFSSLDGAGRVD